MPYYHSSLIENRNSILTHGLLNIFEPSFISLSITGMIFFDSSFNNAKEFQKYMGEDSDIYELINPNKYTLYKDEHWFEGCYTLVPINIKDLKLVLKGKE